MANACKSDTFMQNGQVYIAIKPIFHSESAEETMLRLLFAEPYRRLSSCCRQTIWRFHAFITCFPTVPIDGSLSDALQQPQRKEALFMQGHYPFCEGCHINCYFDPSYLSVRSILYFQSMSARNLVCNDEISFFINGPFPWKPSSFKRSVFAKERNIV